jgi:E3 ubiquitin-protein ligase BOI-like protein
MLVLINSEMMSAIGSNRNVYTTPIGYGVPPLSETLLQMYGSAVQDNFPVKSAVKADSGLTYNLPVSRKRPRESSMINPLISLPIGQFQNSYNNNRCSPFTFLGEDISLQIQQQQMEMDCFVAQHTEKVRRDIEERRKGNSRRMIAAVEEGIVNRLRAKEEEIDKLGKFNLALEERVKSLCVENQIWRDLAQTNETTANALRSNLEQVLTHFQDDHLQRRAAADNQALHDDAQSSCGSNHAADNASEVNSQNERLCRSCRKVESCVLLLPCRHLCLCAACGSSLHTCPVCKSTKEASLHVNFCS